MTVILDKAAQEHWLNVEEFSAPEVYKYLKPADNDVLTAYPVSPRVNKVVNDDAVLLDEISEIAADTEVGTEEIDNQLSLF